MGCSKSDVLQPSGKDATRTAPQEPPGGHSDGNAEEDDKASEAKKGKQGGITNPKTPIVPAKPAAVGPGTPTAPGASTPGAPAKGVSAIPVKSATASPKYPAIKKYWVSFWDTKYKHYSAYLKYHRFPEEACPPPSIQLAGTPGRVISMDGTDSFAQGSESDIYSYGGGQYIVKTIFTAPSPPVVDSLLNERAVSEALSGSKHVSVSATVLTPTCAARTFVSAHLGRALGEFASAGQWDKDVARLRSVARDGLDRKSVV